MLKEIDLGLHIFIDIHPCSFGQCLIVSQDNSTLYGIEVGKTIEDCQASLKKRWGKQVFTYTTLNPNLVEQALNAVEDLSYNLKTILNGTKFQIKVWEALKEIPRGTTATYKEIAIKIGHPKAHRAVANAVGNNPLGIIVPCHRVVRSDGTLGGFRWGQEIKKKLLEREAIK